MAGETYSNIHYDEYLKTGDKNIFEDIIDKMILDQVAGMNDSFRRAISSLPKKDKRMAILSLLDKDRNLFTKIKDSISNESLSKLEHVKDTVLMLREYVKIAEVEKKKFGEVMTPLQLVKEMLATLPIEVWSNPNLKWLDPANGTGPFPIIVIYKLMKGLESWQPDENLRYKHIIENMIYTCELQPKNMFLYLCTIDPKDEYVCNIYTGSFLEEEFDLHMKSVWGIDKFDIVIGNPPYNGAETGGGNSLWDKFIRKSVPLIDIDGYLVFVHPSAWRKPPSQKSKTNDIWKKITQDNQLLYLEIHSTEDGVKVFNAGTRYDFYCMKKTPCYKNTIVIDEMGMRNEINCLEWDFLPNYNLEKIKPLLGKGCPIIFSRSLYASDRGISKEQNDVFNLPLIHSTPKTGIRYMYTDIDRGHFGIPKVIFGESGINHVIIDINGEYGITNSSMGIKVNSLEEAEEIKEFLLNDFTDIIKSCMWGNFRIDWRLFTYFRKDFWKEFI
jgi:hypothetical protein